MVQCDEFNEELMRKCIETIYYNTDAYVVSYIVNGDTYTESSGAAIDKEVMRSLIEFDLNDEG